METQVRKPLLLRIAPVLLIAYAVSSAAFLIEVLGAGSGSIISIGETSIEPGPLRMAIGSLLVLQLCAYVAVAWGFWRGYRWSRPVLVFAGPAVQLILLILLPASARYEILMGLPQAAAFSLAFYGYLYWKPNVREYWESTRTEEDAHASRIGRARSGSVRGDSSDHQL